MQVSNLLHTARWRYRMQKLRKQSSSAHHRTNLSHYIFTTKACIDTTTPPQPFYDPLLGAPGWAGARIELLDFMVQGKINRSRHIDIDHPDGCHSIQTNQCPPPIPHIFYRPDALPAANQQCQSTEGNTCIDNRKKNLLNSNISSTCPQYGEHRLTNGWDCLVSFGLGHQQISTAFVSWLHYCTNFAQQRSTTLCTMFGNLLGWYTIYTFSGAFVP